MNWLHLSMVLIDHAFNGFSELSGRAAGVVRAFQEFFERFLRDWGSQGRPILPPFIARN